jgi:NAD(P)-dependent dehydrogenase (short-subunit alcohol dehydrogenase family)
MANDLKNKVVYITGGSRGIGYGVAERLLESGMKVAISGRNKDSIRTAVSELGRNGDVFAIQSDVGKDGDETKAVEEVVKHFGRLDVLIANAGVGHFKPIDELTDKEWHETIDTNLTGVFHSVKAAIPPLKESRGYIITIASLAGTNFFETASAYNASKFGLVGFTQAIMLDLRKYGIKVSTIMPGSVATHFNNHTPNDEDAWKIQPEDIGELVADLLTMNPRTLPSKIEVRPSMPGGK